MAEPLTVVLADDHYLVREGIRRLLDDSGQIRVLYAVGTAEELLDAVDRSHPDVAITDIRMPPGHHTEGIAAAHTIRSRHPSTGVVVLSQHASEAYAFELLRNGTDGLAYLLKERVEDVDQLIAVIRTIHSGGSFVDPDVVAVLVTRRARLSESPVARLSARELEVLREMAQGKTNPAIAQTLHLSASSIEKHISAIFTKLGLTEEPLTHHRVAAVLAYLRDDQRSQPDHPDGRS